jgi:hypothetical protein
MSDSKMIDNDAIMDYKLFKIKSRCCFKLYFVLHNVNARLHQPRLNLLNLIKFVNAAPVKDLHHALNHN